MRAFLPILLASGISLAFASSSPDSRAITDPKSVTSAEATGAAAVPIDDLFHTSSTSGGAWSPDSNAVVFTSNSTGRANVWKVGAAGGKPLQLGQSDDRQVGALWSPDGKWFFSPSDRGRPEP